MAKPRRKPPAIPTAKKPAKRLQLQRAVEEAEQGILAGNWTEHREVMKKLKRWSFGRN